MKMNFLVVLIAAWEFFCLLLTLHDNILCKLSHLQRCQLGLIYISIQIKKSLLISRSRQLWQVLNFLRLLSLKQQICAKNTCLPQRAGYRTFDSQVHEPHSWSSHSENQTSTNKIVIGCKDNHLILLLKNN